MLVHKCSIFGGQQSSHWQQEGVHGAEQQDSHGVGPHCGGQTGEGQHFGWHGAGQQVCAIADCENIKSNIKLNEKNFFNIKLILH